MEEALLTFGALFGLCTLILPLVALFRTFRIGALEQQINALQAQVSQLAADLKAVASQEQPAKKSATTAPLAFTPPVSTEHPAPTDKPAPPPPAPAPAFEWERWLGIRGAAVAGAVVLALALILFVKYSIEQGWLSPSMRVALGALASIAALVSSEALRKRFGDTSNALASAGIVGLYAATWAARALYELIPMELALVLMVLTTAVCALLAVRHHSVLIATLGLAGGFATPFLLSTGSNRPIALFGYVLVLDVAFVIVAIKKKWHGIALMALVGTALTQIAWVAKRAEPDEILLALGILTVFAALFAVALNRPANDETARRWLFTRVAAVLLPFGFALYFALGTSWPLPPLPLAGFLALLCAAAFWISLQENLEWLSLSAVTAAAGVLLLRTFSAPASGTPWQWASAILLLAVLSHAALWWGTRKKGDDFALFDLSVLAKMSLLVGAAFSVLWQRTEPTLLPYAVTGLGLAALMYERSLRSVKRLGWAAPTSGVLALFWVLLVRGGVLFASGTTLDFTLLTLVAIAGVLLGIALRSVENKARETWLRSAVVLAVCGVFFFAMSPSPTLLEPWVAWVFVAGLVAIATFAGSLVDGGLWLPVAVLASGFFAFILPVKTDTEFFTVAAITTGLSLWPILAGRHVQASRWGIYASAGTGAVHFFQLHAGWTGVFGNGAIGGLALALAILPVIALARVLPAWKSGSPEHRRAMTWYGAVALCFLALSIPLQLERQWIWVAWAAQGAVLITLLWPRVQHEGLKYFGLTLLVLAVGGLTFHPLISPVFFRQERPLPLLNWTLYSYGVPFLGLLWSAMTLRKFEETRSQSKLGLITSGALTLWLGFVWINVSIADVFSSGDVLAYHHVPAHDLSMSVAWGIYALVILAIGMRRASKGLRWSSLGLLLVTLGKVALYDLGHLKDLYLAASLAGLAISLLLVSIAYQRFVFQKKPETT
jgi:uncharacterized membrane protein